MKKNWIIICLMLFSLSLTSCSNEDGPDIEEWDFSDIEFCSFCENRDGVYPAFHFNYEVVYPNGNVVDEHIYATIYRPTIYVVDDGEFTLRSGKSKLFEVKYLLEDGVKYSLKDMKIGEIKKIGSAPSITVNRTGADSYNFKFDGPLVNKDLYKIQVDTKPYGVVACPHKELEEINYKGIYNLNIDILPA